LIQKLIPSAERVRFVNSGSEGTMLALRLARAFTVREKLLRFEGHFSGWHDFVGKGAMLPFNEPVSAGIPTSTLDTILVVPADLQGLEETFRRRNDIAAVMLEPSGASWGTVPLTAEFNRELRRLTAKYGIVLIYDEIITGFRYSPGGYQGLVDIRPDLSVLGKIVAGGMPGGAVVGRADIMALFDYTGDPQHDRYQRIHHLGTFNANPLSAAAGIVTLKKVATGEPQAHADRLAVLLRDGMDEILEQEGAAGYVYGDSSIFHTYLEAHPGSGVAHRGALRTNDPKLLKGIPGSVVSAFQKNLQVRGMDLLSYTGGVTSAAHTEHDINQTLDMFQDTIRTLVRERVIARVG
jgi:glutamate-1-semialdehyde 2,1-aminomutase